MVKFMDKASTTLMPRIWIMNLERVRLCRQGAAGILPAVLFSDLSAGKMPGMCLACRPRP